MADALVTNTVAVIPDWTTGGGGGVSDHGALTGLGDDDHPQYTLATRLVTAGAGLTGGGDLSADRTLDVVAADTTITVNANSIQVGAIADANVAAGAAVAHSKLADLAGASVLGRSAVAGGAMAAISGATIGHVLTVQGDNTLAFSAPAAAGDHGALTGLGDDDHAQYALLAGRNTGQTLIGDTASGGNLILQSTSHATRGVVQVNDNLTVTRSANGVTVQGLVSNSSNTASSAARLAVSVAGSSGGNPSLRLSVNGATDWDLVVDNSSSDRIALVCGATTPMYAFATGNGVAFGGGVPSDARKRFYVLQAVADDWMEFENTVAANAVRNIVFRNNGGRSIDIGFLGSSAAGTGHFGIANAGFKYIVSNDSSTSGIAFGSLDTGPLTFGTNNVSRMRFDSSGNVVFGAGAGSFGSGAKVFMIENATTVPSTNPTGGGILYAEAGALKWRGSGGTVTTIAPA